MNKRRRALAREGKYFGYLKYAFKSKTKRSCYCGTHPKHHGRMAKRKMKAKFNLSTRHSEKDSRTNTFKSLVHREEYSKFNLCRAHPIDSSKTIHASYCQGNIEVFGLNAGSQCVAMSFRAFLYSYKQSPNRLGEYIEYRK